MTKSDIIKKLSENMSLKKKIAEEVIDTIFEAKVTTKKYGTGMGLYLSRLIIEKIDGKIGVTNIDNGAEFKILFKN